MTDIQEGDPRLTVDGFTWPDDKTWRGQTEAERLATLARHSEHLKMQAMRRDRFQHLSDADLKDAVSELLSARGERPYRVLRGGQELWETWVDAFRAAIRYLPE